MKKLSACTTVLVGKKATIDGSTMAARNDDTFKPLTPQHVVVYPAYHDHPNQVHSYLNAFVGDRPADGARYQGVPNVNFQQEGVYDENGFNEFNVGMSATESVYANERVLAYDPLNETSGINEDVIVAMVLPFIHSAKEGVQYLGELVAKYGSAEGNGVIFVDQNDVWYMEIVTGHHWVAQRIPDDSYAVTGNRVAIQTVDFDDPDNFMWSDGIREFVAHHHLNPDLDTWNFRHIFGTATTFDQHYNTPRQWYGHRVLSPTVDLDPLDFDLPFILPATHQLTLEDVQTVLSSHYQGTVYDPLGNGTDHQKSQFRPISLNRTQNSHILQVRADVPASVAPIMWMTIGVPTFTPYVPFFGNGEQIDASYRHTPMTYDRNTKSAYWMYRELSMLVESHYGDFLQADLDYLKEVRQYLYTQVALVTQQVMEHPDQATKLIDQAHQTIVRELETRTNQLIGQLIMHGLELSKLTFKMDANL
ncbi:C69 family dipeptidase [Limosilactobacillus equigenerosi]|uniref:Dipeptidase n=1 Tax=Limosilactobacillus equigenerosi DSM 18793 = JCM 14505 TaxID=1423742 RepID=A0A0R1UPA4_9LACO|nr:C69 family dipeptidase [Limosilactobacillus equigenerosi]KRL95071.1 dipeptidase [Limosilactobacillus equigenerosi DSM 18793 = JCM 14505]